MSVSSRPKSTPSPLLADGTYDKLKRTTSLVLPALGAAYFTLSQIWHLPNGEEVVGTVAAVNVLLGVILGLSDRAYGNSMVAYDGSLVVRPTGETAEMRISPETAAVMETKKAVLLRVEVE